MRANRQEWRKRVERLKDSGLTVEEFASETGLNANSLRYWKSIFNQEAKVRPRPAGTERFKKDSPAAPASPSQAPEPPERLPLVEVHTTLGSTDKRFELELSQGWRLRVPCAFEAKELRMLLGVLKEVA